MPELPEVETVRRGLQRLIVGKKVARVTHDTPKSFPNAEGDVREFLVGSTILEARRRAKILLVDLDSDYTLVIHLKMTGQLVFIAEKNEKGNMKNDELHWGAGHPNDSLVNNLPDKSTRVEFTFSDNSRLFFNDQRKFGWVKLYPTVEVPNIDFMKRVGPEPLEDDFTAEQFRERFQRRKKTNIKAALLDQSVVAGVGNIYADESLWSAKIHPRRLVSTITDDEFTALYHAVRAVMNLSIDKGGSSSHTYMDAEGNKGSYLLFANVFRREGQACNRCGTTIEKTRVAGRGTHICPVCQQSP
ncbi:bifunctional DNA-formamidopyrimidine glycosylase/DNA-(apurinic or apyrimidinic site) lyase [Candidatus Saccharibacteria bacterium]|nr:MAG: bifunctional DNA-formamidopyrimidine glycosylase/DNA-(apurinic or apyrimidinic site) lyase [Candidatus Saccharibacteria bacterium]